MIGLFFRLLEIEREKPRYQESKKKEVKTIKEPTTLYELYLYRAKQIHDLLITHWYKQSKDYEITGHRRANTVETTFKKWNEEVRCWFYEDTWLRNYWVFYFTEKEKIILDFRQFLFQEKETDYWFTYHTLRDYFYDKIKEERTKKEFTELCQKTSIIWSSINPEFDNLFRQLKEIEETRTKLLQMIQKLEVL